MSGARDRLGQLLTLTAERRWTPLARELCDLTLYWPPEFPEAMHGPVTALLETALWECDEDTRRELAARLAGHGEIPLRVMNVLYLGAGAPLRREILMRNELEGDAALEAADSEAVLMLARKGARDFAAALSDITGLPYTVMGGALSDASGEALAVLCRGLGLSRAIFSAIALLRVPVPMPLDVFDTVPDRAAASLVHSWRTRPMVNGTSQVAAAE